MSVFSFPWTRAHVAIFVLFLSSVRWNGIAAAVIVSRSRPFVNVINLSDRHLSYGVAWEMQKELMQQHIDAQESETIPTAAPCVGSVIICQHSPVYTLGTATTTDSGPFSRTLPDGTSLTYETFQVERAGQATYHGPGQLVCYPIMDLTYFQKDINWYLRSLEQSIIDTLTAFDIASKRIEEDGLTGVWVNTGQPRLSARQSLDQAMPREGVDQNKDKGRDSKIAAIGIKLRRWVTMHGLSLNVCPDMRYFSNIVPCGITDVSKNTVAAMDHFLPGISLEQVVPVFLDCFCRHFDVDTIHVAPPESLSLSLPETEMVTKTVTERNR